MNVWLRKTYRKGQLSPKIRKIHLEGSEMSYSNDLINAMKKEQKIPSDNQAAAILGLSRSTISNIRAGRNNLSPESTIKAAKLANIDIGIALVSLFEETIKDLETRQYAEKYKLKNQ